MARRLVVALGLLSAVLAVLLGFLVVKVRDPMTPLELGNQGFTHFIDQPRTSDLTQVTENVYAAHWLHYTSLVVKTAHGLLVVDPANARSAGQLKQALAERFPGLGVHTLVYSHYHKDHAEGGRVLGASRIIAHKDVPRYLADYPGHDVQEPTEFLEGRDTSLEIDGTRLELLYLPEGHTTTNFAVYLPAERTVYVADLMAAKAMPFILMDMYVPAVVRNLERLSQLDVDWVVPSHFLPGNKQDLRDSIAFLKRVQSVSRDAFARHGPLDKTSGLAIQAQIYGDLKREYGHLHGFDDLYVPFITRAFLGEMAGF